MPRSKGGTVARKAHKKVIKKAAGYFSRRKNIFRVAVQAVSLPKLLVPAVPDNRAVNVSHSCPNGA